MTTGTDETKTSKHLILLGRILLPIIALLALWGMKTVGVMLSSIKLETIENNPGVIVQTIFVWTAFVIIAVLTYRVGVLFKLWKSIGVGERVKSENTPYSSSAYERGERKRFPLGAAVWTLVGLALATFIVVKILQEIDYGLSNAPERMAARGYVPREQVAAARAAAQPALPEAHIITAPAFDSINGKTNWSEEVIRREDKWFYLFVSDSLTNWVERRVDGVVTNFGAVVTARRHEFRSRTNHPIEVRWIQSERRLTAEERKAIN